MKRIRVKDLVSKLMDTMPTSSQTDRLFEAIDEEYSFFREKPWVWNWKWTQTITKAQVSEVPTFDWTEGNDYVVASAALTYNYLLTGRLVKLGSEWYRVIDYGVANAARIYVDRPILGSGEDQTLSFCRDDLAIRTSLIRGLKMDERTLRRKHEEDLLARMPEFYSYTPAEAGTPVLWLDEIKSREIPAPGYAPTVTTSGVGALAAGDYEYFFTRYDTESGQESAPGPSTIYQNTSGFNATVIYGNPSGDVSESTSYQFRLYRSRVNSKDKRARRPMWLVNSRPPSASTFVDSTSDVVLVTLPRYYNGSTSLIRLYPPPDTTRHSLQINHVNCWEGRPHDDEYLEEGRNQEFSSLMLIYLRSILDFGENTDLYLTSQMSHRRHIDYLLTKSTKAGDAALTEGNYVEALAGPERDGNWVDRAPWKSDW